MEVVGGADGFGIRKRNRDAVSLRELESKVRLERALDMNMKLGLGSP